MGRYEPPYRITSRMFRLSNDITELLTQLEHIKEDISTPVLRRKNRVRSITGSLQIEGNTLSEDEITAILNGKRVIGSVREIEEVKGAIKAYEMIERYDSLSLSDLLLSHKLMMGGILENAGEFRRENVGVFSKNGVSHIAPPAYRVDSLMSELFKWLVDTDEHPLLTSSIFHYEFEFIHPFSDGNGRVGRLWQSVILGNYKNIFYYIPIESIVKEYQGGYYKALEESGIDGESTIFIEFMLDTILTSLKNFLVEYQKSDQKNDQKSDQKIYELMKQDRNITIKELSLRLKMSESGVKKAINKLKTENRIKRVGSAKGGYWQITE